jgi:hypothetical protein
MGGTSCWSSTPSEQGPSGREPSTGDPRSDVGAGRRAAVFVGVASSLTIAPVSSCSRGRASTALITRRCAGGVREDDLAGVEQEQARVALKRCHSYEARCCAIWEKRVRLGHWDLRIALRGRNLSEVRSCCRSEDRPHSDALGHRLYSVRGDTQAAGGPGRSRPLSRSQAVRPDPPEGSGISCSSTRSVGPRMNTSHIMSGCC